VSGIYTIYIGVRMKRRKLIRVDKQLNLRVSAETMQKLKELAARKKILARGGGYCVLAREMILESIKKEFGAVVVV